MCEDRAEEAKNPGPGPPMQTLADLGFSFGGGAASPLTRVDRAPPEQRTGSQPSQKHYVPRIEEESRPLTFSPFASAFKPFWLAYPAQEEPIWQGVAGHYAFTRQWGPLPAIAAFNVLEGKPASASAQFKVQ